MRFKVDQNLHDDLADLLLAEGYDVHTVHTEGLRGCDDRTLADRCKAEARTLVTLDLDFADIRTFPPADYAGIIVLRVGNQSRRHVLNVMGQVLDLLKREPLSGRLWIISEGGVRIRA